jgi:ubiquinone/menaquinone biosynthesis C-methylase UbiE
VLDVGAASGDYAADLSNDGFDVACCDTNLLDLRIARSKHADMEQIVARVQQLPFTSESFDAVMILNAFRYFFDSPSALGESYRVINDEGTLILLDHNRCCPDSVLVKRDVIRYYTVTELTNLLEKAGFVPSSFKMLFIPPPVESAFLLAATLQLGAKLQRVAESIYPEILIVAKKRAGE